MLYRMLKLCVQLLQGLAGTWALYRKAVRYTRQLKQKIQPEKESAKPMKKSVLITIVALLAAVAGALAVVAVYLRRREKDLDEYENLLFSEEFAEEEAPAEQAPAEEAAAEQAPAEEPAAE